jgi:hypothetical protein
VNYCNRVRPSGLRHFLDVLRFAPVTCNHQLRLCLRPASREWTVKTIHTSLSFSRQRDNSVVGTTLSIEIPARTTFEQFVKGLKWSRPTF